MNSLLRLLALCGLLASGLQLAAQPQTPPVLASTGTPLDATPTSPPKSKGQISIDFPGGSITELIAMLNQLGVGDFNVLGEPADLATRLPAFSLRNSDPHSLGLALNGFLRSRDLAMNLAGGNIFVVGKSSFPIRTTTPANANFQTFQLAPMLENLTVDDITDAIRVALELDPAHDPKALRFKYHPATKLLFIYGPPEAITIASQVMPHLRPASFSVRSVGDGTVIARSLNPGETPAESAARLADWQVEIERRRQQRSEQGKVAPTQSPPEKKK